VNEDTSLHNYLKHQRDMYRNQKMWGDLPKESPIRVADIYDWFLENAVNLEGMDLELADKAIQNHFYEPEIKQCYYNSMMMMIPLNHAWNVQDGKVVDTTWSLLEHQREGAEDLQYLGVKIPSSFIMELMSIDTKFKPANTAGPFIWDYAIKCIQEKNGGLTNGQ
jgi:hypothetical protein